MPRTYTTTPQESKRRSEAMKTKARPARTLLSDKIAGQTRSNLIEIGKEHEKIVQELKNRIHELEYKETLLDNALQKLENATNVLRSSGLDILL